MRDDELGASEDIDDVEGAGRLDGLDDGPERRDPEDAALVGVDRYALEALVDEVAEYAERGAPGVRGRADDGDAPGRRQDSLDLGIVGGVDRAAAFVEVEVRDRALLRLAPAGRVALLGQDAPSLTYGRPTAAGAMLRPTTPARTMIVRTYGRALKMLL